MCEPTPMGYVPGDSGTDVGEALETVKGRSTVNP